uniref:Calcineurin-like phosphoesterase domain-containing protein n=1 Tax=Ciona savignyi TaxID=51511 RepID=H2YPK9_CIOSA
MTLLSETKTTPGNSIASQRETQLNSANSCPGRSAQVNSKLPPSCGRENSRVYGDSANFLEKCTSKRKLRISPLTGNFHLCRVEESKSSRKPSLRTQRSTGSTASGETYNRSPLFNEDVFSFDSNGHGNSPTRLTREISVEKEKRLSSPGGKMGCRLSSVERLKDANGSSNDEDVDPPADNDVGMTSVSKADLLDAQRLNLTDVTRGLENRWIRSHFQEQSKNTNSDATRAKRRKSKVCVSDPDETDTTAVLSEVRNHLSILHFNDVYEITQRKKEPVGGAARFATLIKRLVEETTRKTGEKPLVVFSGDCLNPSTLSCATQGRHMIEILDTLGVDVAVFGNHEFDFGVEHATTCVSKMSSKWLLGNVIDKLTQRNLGDGLSKLIIERKNGIKIGLLGLVEEEWLDTLATVNKSDLDFQDYVDRGRELAAELRADGADFVIALTHMRWPNDIR